MNSFHHPERSEGAREPAALLPANGVPAGIEVARAPYVAGQRYYSPEIEDDADSDSGLLQYWRILGRHKKAIVLCAFLGVALGVAIGIPMDPVFRARTSLEVLNINEDFMNMKQSNPVTTSDNSYETSEEETQAKLLEGEVLQNRVMAKLDPDRPASLVKPRMATGGWRKWLHRKEPVPMTAREKLLAQLASSLRIRPTVRTRILEVTADSTDPRLASDFVNTLVGEFMQQNVEAHMNSSQSTSEWLRREIDDARASLQRAENALQIYARDSGLIFTDENTSIATEKLQQLQSQLSIATADRITKQSHFELARTSPPDTLGDVLNDDGFKDTSAKMLDLRRQVASLSAVFTPGYSKLQQAQAELATLDSTFQTERNDILKHIENDYVEATGKEKMLAAAYDTQAHDVTGQGEKLTQYNILKREADSSRQLYDTMLQQTKQAAIATAMRASNVRVVDTAAPPSLAIFPNFKLNAILGLFAGLFLSIVFVTAHERADRTLQQPGDIKLWTDLTELGTIPAESVGRSWKRIGHSRSLSRDTSSDGSRAVRRGNTFELVTSRQTASIAAEAFRSTLTSILFMGDGGNRPRVIAFTSASPQDGKTSIVSNLALATAEIRRKVLVVDADLRRPRMHDIFDVANERGLGNILREELSAENLSGLVQQTRVPGLDVLCAGPPTQAAAHLLYSPNFAALLAGLRSQYDMILVDTPPMLQMTDARVAARLVDAVVLVARSGKTTRDSLLAARDRFMEDRIVVLGTILNDWNPGKAPGGYYGYGDMKAYKQYLKA
jgi:capsular exopolysaccharide synthesis family protein